ncbi:response regulator transcription factor [Nocardia sp. NPDC004604]|uniref:response regulator transcription factor n=1 Tax=Nocardia sp. NPDC004604 TaxID=3157013 RepID=UPI00339F6BFB
MSVRLLVVEDDAGLARVLVRGLREEGHAVDHAPTLAEADDLCSYNDYALVVLDLGLPDGDGLSLCRQLKADGRTRVLVLTARGSATDRVTGLDTGADDYVTKPFDFGELAARVRAVLRRPVTRGGSLLRVGDLKLDMATHRVWRAEVLIPLTAKEFAVVQYLMQQSGQTVSRTELLEQVWDLHYEGTSNVVDVYVSTLRRKLDLPTARTRLDTVRGVGFHLYAEE